MRQALSGLALVLALSLPITAPVRSEDAPPPLSELRKPVVAAKVSENKPPPTPAMVSSARRVPDPGQICPAGAVGYLAVPDAARLVRDWDLSPPGKLMGETAMANLWKNNRFGLKHLFSDVPATAAGPAQIAAIAGAADLFPIIAKQAERFSLAVYINADGAFSFLLLFDIGLNRLPAFEILSEWETAFNLANPGATVARGDHAGNYLDVWRLDSGPGTELAVGFAENMALASNDASLAAKCLTLLDKGENLAASSWGKRLAASIPSSSSADAVGFLRMDAILAALSTAPLAREMAAQWADYLGSGGAGGEAIYYGLEFTPEGSRETYILPAAGDSTNSSLVELLAERLQLTKAWTTPQAIPYQPTPTLFLAANIEPEYLGWLLAQQGRLFGQSLSGGGFHIPNEAQYIFNKNIANLLTGEFGVAYFPLTDEGSGADEEWLLVLPCSDNPQPYLEKATNTVERNRTNIYSPSAEWRKSVSWSAVHPGVFRRLGGNFLLLASTGDLLVSVLDQLTMASSFAANRDFAGRLAQAEDGHGLLFYLNTPETLVRAYPNLSRIMRNVYPRSSGLSSRPPLTVLRRYARGAMGVVNPKRNGGDFIRATVQAPMPTFLTMIGASVLRFPMLLRADGRKNMKKSQENLKELWLKLQEYASRFGHFPESLDHLKESLAADDIPESRLTELFTAPAALSRLTPAEAERRSFQLLAGVLPADEPDIPLVYEAEPWSDDFTGMYADDPTRSQSESGDFAPYRQFIQLDGEVMIMTEKRFRDKILPRLAERE